MKASLVVPAETLTLPRGPWNVARGGVWRTQVRPAGDWVQAWVWGMKPAFVCTG